MSQKILGMFPALALIVLLFIAGAGCTNASDEEVVGSDLPSTTMVDDIFAQAEIAMADSSYRTAASYYGGAYQVYRESDNAAGALLARNGMFRATRATIEYPLNRTAAEVEMQEIIPLITEANMTAWLDERAQTIVSDGETLYFENVAQDFLYAHVDDLRPMADTMIDFGYVSRYAIPEETFPADDGSVLPYVNPIHYTGTEELLLPADFLPATGSLSIWYPLPLETESQRDVLITNLSYEECIITGPVMEGQIGYVCYEIPVDVINGDLLLTADIAFSSYEQHFVVDPVRVKAYDTMDPEYLRYTSSGRNIEVTDESRALAMAIVDNETNPYLQAQVIYHYIIDTYPYSYAPHVSIDTIEPKVAESSYMLATGHGDCGTQSQFFAALCRSLGIPARATGGYQTLITGQPGPHFWAQYYIEGYGWIPCDTTVAEIADWVDIPEEDRKAFKNYYANNLDPTRLVIQKDVDALMDPAIPADAVIFRQVRQYPAVVCDEAETDLGLLAMEHFTISLEGEE